MINGFDEQIWWLVARAGGVVALILVAASVLWGLLLSSKYLDGGPKPKGLLHLHRYLGGLSVLFTGIHLLGLYLDSYIQFTVAELLVPFVSTWRPGAVAAGVVSFWFLIAVQGTSTMMRHLPRRFWKWIHLTSYLLLPLGVLHGIIAGTDASETWYRLGSGALIGLLAWLTAWRAWRVPARKRAAGQTAEQQEALVASAGALG
ncbi:MAG: ferric reductase-like transmembrane domain-containing protein [Acidimicrobiales bacterium]